MSRGLWLILPTLLVGGPAAHAPASETWEIRLVVDYLLGL